MEHSVSTATFFTGMNAETGPGQSTHALEKEESKSARKYKEELLASASQPLFTSDNLERLVESLPTNKGELRLSLAGEKRALELTLTLPNTDIIDPSVMNQLLEFDEDYEFIQGLVQDFFNQFEDQEKKMQQYLAQRQLVHVSESAHYLKGSSAALGMSRVKEVCEAIQKLCKLDPASTLEDGLSVASKIQQELDALHVEIQVVKRTLYDSQGRFCFKM